MKSSAAGRVAGVSSGPVCHCLTPPSDARCLPVRSDLFGSPSAQGPSPSLAWPVFSTPVLQ